MHEQGVGCGGKAERPSETEIEGTQARSGQASKVSNAAVVLKARVTLSLTLVLSINVEFAHAGSWNLPRPCRRYQRKWKHTG